MRLLDVRKRALTASTEAYALEALLLFSAAGRSVPPDRLVPWGDEAGPTESVLRAARSIVHRLRHRRGLVVEFRPAGYRLILESTL